MTEHESPSPEKPGVDMYRSPPEESGSSSGVSLSEPAWQALILVSTAVVLLVSFYCLSHGITMIFMHLLYFPIILLAYHYRYRGFLIGTLLALAYVWLVYLFQGGELDVVIGAWLRFFVFAGVAAVVAYLSEHLSADQKALQESEKKCRTLFESMMEGFAYCRMIYDDTGKPVDWVYLDVNPAFEKLTGLKNIHGKRVLEPIPNIRTLTPELFDTYGRVASTGIPESFEIDFLPLKMWLKVSVFSPEKGYFVTAFEDVSERHAAENALRVSEERLSLAIAATSDGLWDWNLSTDHVYWSPRTYEMLGYTPDEFPVSFTVWKDLIHPDDREAAEKNVLSQLKEGGRFSAEFRYRMKDGTWKWILGRGRAVGWDGKGEVTRMVGTHVDLTERKLAEDEAANKSRFLTTLINTLPIPVFYKSIDGKYLGCNPPFEEYIGIRHADLVGKTVFDINPKDLAEIYQAADQEVFTTSSFQKYDAQVRFADGSRHDVIFYKAPFLNHDGSVGGLIGTFLDITKLKQTEDALRMVNKKLNLLSGITRHDINNQLFSLKAFLELSKESLEDTVQTTEYLLKANQAAQAIERQIAFTKEYQDLGVNAPVWQEVSTCVKNAGMSLPMRNIRVLSGIGDLLVYADPLFEKVFYNLIDNALRYGGSTLTEIRISSHESERGLVISVEDDGMGISPQDKDRLFERGFGHHTGLGLFLSREILAITGITITETGESGKGARFEILVPKEGYRVNP